MKKIISTISLVCMGIWLNGCGSGTNNNSSKQNTPPTGPISYERIHAMFHPNRHMNLVGKNLQDDTITGGSHCGGIMTDVGTGASTAAGFISFIPEAGPVLGALFAGIGSIFTLFGGNKASSCATYGGSDAQYQNFLNQLAMQQSEINEISSNLNLSTNSIWAAINQGAAATAATDYGNYSTSVGNVSGNSGQFLKILEAAGFYAASSNPSTPSGLTNLTLSQFMESSTLVNSFSTKIADIAGNDNLQKNLINIAGVDFSSGYSSSESAYLFVQQASYGIQGNDSQYLILLNAVNNYLQTQLIETITAGNNGVQVLDDYNNLIVSYYQQSLIALQEYYAMLYLANYVNYYNTFGVVVQNPTNIPGIYYGSGSVSEYNQAQENLTQLFAASVNQLYSNTLNFIVTDTPVGSQAYPNSATLPYINESGVLVNSAESINYSQLIGANLPKNQATGAQNLFYGFTNNTNPQTNQPTQNQNLQASMESIPGVMLYQYGGIANVATCVNSVESYNMNSLAGNLESALSNVSSCPSIATNPNSTWNNGATFTNATLIPYYTPNSSTLPSLTGPVTNNINDLVCNGTAVGDVPAWNMYIYTPTGANNNAYGAPTTASLGVTGIPYLMCGNWQTTGLYVNGNTSLVENDGLYYSQLLMGVNEPTNSNSWTQTTYFSIYNNLATAPSSSNVPVNFDSLPGQNFILMSTNNGDAWGTSSSNQTNWTNQPSGTPINQIAAGNLSNIANPPNWCASANMGRTNIAVVQTTFADGFIGSFGIDTTNVCGYSNTASVSINPNMLSATINGQSIIDTSDISFDNSYNANFPGPTGTPPTLPYSSISNLGWLPVISNDQYINGYSALMLNGNRITLGDLNTGGGADGVVYVYIFPLNAEVANGFNNTLQGWADLEWISGNNNYYNYSAQASCSDFDTRTAQCNAWHYGTNFMMLK